MLQQIQRADFAIDRIVNSAIALIQLQPAEHQTDIACAWILGATIIADAVGVCLREIRDVEGCVGDFIRLENSWATVQSSVESSVAALRGILNLMAVDEHTEEFKRRSSSSVSNMGGGLFRKFSTAVGLGGGPPPPPPPYRKSRTGSQASTHFSSISSESNPSALRRSFVNAIPTRMPKTPRSSVSTISSSNGDHAPSKLATIPATPAEVAGITMVDPFDQRTIGAPL